MKIVSWNINGIRTFRNNFKELFKELESNVICLQETKASRSTLEEDLVIIPGYNSYFSSPRYLSGYSGVATYCLDSCRPDSAEEGFTGIFVDCRFKQDCVGHYPEFEGFESGELSSLESEGRTLVTKHSVKLGQEVKSLIIINVYCPRMDPDRPERAKYKLQFYNLLQQRAENLVKSGHHVIIAGDINTSHKPIDTCHSVAIEEFCSAPSRKWMDGFLVYNSDTGDSIDGRKAMFVDTFRYFHPDQAEAYTCWMSVTGARKTNFGTRIDYMFADVNLLPYLESASILSDLEGSDHCPISITINGELIPAKKCPSICSKYWPEFTGKQQNLASFLSSSNPVTKQPLSKCNVQNPQQTITNFFKTKNKISVVDPNATSQQTTEKVEGKDGNEFEEVGVDGTEEKEKTSLHATWKALFKGPPKPPMCTGHQEPCLLRTVKKQGPNLGRQFFVCCRAEGKADNPEARCDFFKWATAPKLKKLSR